MDEERMLEIARVLLNDPTLTEAIFVKPTTQERAKALGLRLIKGGKDDE